MSEWADVFGAREQVFVLAFAVGSGNRSTALLEDVVADAADLAGVTVMSFDVTEDDALAVELGVSDCPAVVVRKGPDGRAVVFEGAGMSAEAVAKAAAAAAAESAAALPKGNVHADVTEYVERTLPPPAATVVLLLLLLLLLGCATAHPPGLLRATRATTTRTLLLLLLHS